MKAYLIVLLTGLLYFSVVGQVPHPVDTSFANSIFSYEKEGHYKEDYYSFQRTLNNNPRKSDLFFFKAKTKDNFYSITLYRDCRRETDIRFFPGKNKVRSIMQIKNNVVDGKVIMFNKRGKIEIIADYKNGKLMDVIYYRKKKFLKKYLDIFKNDAPLIISDTVSEDCLPVQLDNNEIKPE